jgi:hypothetical protein
VGIHHHDGGEVELLGPRALIVEPVRHEHLSGLVHEVKDENSGGVGEEEGDDRLPSRSEDFERDPEPGVGEREDARVQNMNAAHLRTGEEGRGKEERKEGT